MDWTSEHGHGPLDWTGSGARDRLVLDLTSYIPDLRKR